MTVVRKSLVRTLTGALVVAGMAVGATAFARTPGVTDDEILIGNVMPYSGPASSLGVVGKAMTAYFQKVNDEGGINGRRINFLSVDDAYNPARTVEQTRRLLERDGVLLTFGSLGTAQNMAVRKYMNAKKVPQLFVQSGASHWATPEEFPWTMGWVPNYRAEGRAYAQHILQTQPDARVAVLYQNDDYGKDLRNGVLQGLGDKAKDMIVAEVTYETSDPTVDSQLVNLKSSGANVLISLSTPKFAAQTIRKIGEMGWKPTHYLASAASSRASVLMPAGVENSTGVLTARYLRDPSDHGEDSHPGMQEYKAWHAKYFSDQDVNDAIVGYSGAQTLVHVLEKAGDDLSRENVMKVAADMDFVLPLLYDGIRVKTGPNDYQPIEALQLVRFTGKGFEKVDGVIGQ